MTELTDRLVLSVRGEARQSVAPDLAIVAVTITVSQRSTAQALDAAARTLESLIADLATLGGLPLEPETERQPLTWSAQSATTYAERGHDPSTGHSRVTGRIIADVSVQVAIRNFELVAAVEEALSRAKAVAVDHVGWHVDPDNPAWPGVRAAAISAAIRKGRDYAAALGGSVQHISHVADVGLLGPGGAADHQFARHTAWAAARAGRGAESATPALDPVPQELTATIEARFLATGASLD